MAPGRRHGNAPKRYLSWVRLLPIGVTGLWAGLARVFFPRTAAAHIPGPSTVNIRLLPLIAHMGMFWVKGQV
jgi:hypothetical protein